MMASRTKKVKNKKEIKVNNKRKKLTLVLIGPRTGFIGMPKKEIIKEQMQLFREDSITETGSVYKKVTTKPAGNMAPKPQSRYAANTPSRS